MSLGNEMESIFLGEGIETVAILLHNAAGVSHVLGHSSRPVVAQHQSFTGSSQRSIVY